MIANSSHAFTKKTSISLIETVIFLLPVLAVVGPYLPVLSILGVEIFGFRAVILLILPMLILWQKRSFLSMNMHFEDRLYLLLGISWVFYGLISLFWTIDVASGLRELSSIVLGYVLLFQLVVVAAGYWHRLLFILSLGWIFAFIIVTVVVIWELFTGLHLPSYYISSAVDSNKGYLLDQVFVQGTSGQPNNLAAFISLSFPFTLYFVLFRHIRPGKKDWLAFFIVSITSIMIMFLTGSRLGVIALLFVIVLSITLRENHQKLLFLIPVAIFAILGFGFIDQVTSQIYSVNKFGRLLEMDSAIADTSSEARFSIYLIGFWFLANSFGFGIGAGGFEESVQKHALQLSQMVSLPDIVNPHSIFLEIASQYGLVIVLTFLYWFLYSTHRGILLLRNKEKTSQTTKNISFIVISATITYLITGSVSSSYLDDSVSWMFLGTLFVAKLSLFSERTKNQ